MKEEEKWKLYGKFPKHYNVKCCLAPKAWAHNCDKKISKAHTVFKAKGLRPIAREGKVYGFIPTPHKFEKYSGNLLPELIEINQASTFTGFCSHHDNGIFSPIEKKPFVPTNQEHLFLLMYRAFSRELYMKMAQLSSSLERFYEGYLTFGVEEDLLFLSAVKQGVEDNIKQKVKLDRMLTNHNFSKMKGYILIFEEKTPLMLSTGFYPEQDFFGNSLQDLTDFNILPSCISITSFFEESLGGIIAFSWLDDGKDVCFKFTESLEKTKISEDHELTNLILGLFFTHSENIFISPRWWEELNDSKKSYLLNRLYESTDVAKERGEFYLRNAGPSFEPWSLKETIFIK